MKKPEQSCTLPIFTWGLSLRDATNARYIKQGIILDIDKRFMIRKEEELTTLGKKPCLLKIQ